LFHTSPPLTQLHSFPTRRSSDLTGQPIAERSYLSISCSARLLAAGASRQCPSHNANGDRGIVFQASSAKHACRVMASLDFVHNVDRKSTRLNSSHDQISYAVFCL